MDRSPAISRMTRRVVWTALVLISVGLFVAAFPARAEQIVSDSYNLETGLRELGVTTRHFIVYATVLDLAAGLVFTACGVFLYWRRSDDRMVWLVSISIVMEIVTVLPVTTALKETHPFWNASVSVLRMLGLIIFGVTMIVFPDGRFNPAWTRVFAGIWIGYGLLGILFPEIQPMADFVVLRTPEGIVRSIPFIIFSSLVFLSQFYRYRFVYSQTQRQQVKWVMLGLLAFFSLVLVLILVPLLSPALRDSARLYAGYILFVIPISLAGFIIFPISLVFAVLRYRLWDIDIIIRRTLQYAILSGLIGLAYFSIIALLQNIFAAFTDQRSPLIIVVSTLSVAALFSPLRRRVQVFIDRRFYREKYSSEKALAEFAAVARDEVDIDRLSSALLRVIDESMRPERISLWLA